MLIRLVIPTPDMRNLDNRPAFQIIRDLVTPRQETTTDIALPANEAEQFLKENGFEPTGKELSILRIRQDKLTGKLSATTAQSIAGSRENAYTKELLVAKILKDWEYSDP